MPSLKKLKVVMKTSAVLLAGTDARIYLVFALRSGSRIYLLPTRQADLEAGRLDDYEVALADGPDLQDVVTIVLVNGMSGQNPGWKVLWIKLDAVDSDGQSWRLVDVVLDRWLANGEGIAPVAVLPLERPWLHLGAQDVVPRPTSVLRSV